jgi:membrane protease YdiL (CAAX protease family)
VFSFLPLYRSADTVFLTVIAVNIVLTGYALWGLSLAGEKPLLSVDEIGSAEEWLPNIAIGAAVGIGLIGASIFITKLIPGAHPNAAPDLAHTTSDHALELFMYIFISICEEIRERGYFMRQIVSLTSNISIAVIVQAILFVLMHGFEQGLSGVVVRLVFSIAFGLLTISRRSLLPSIVAHSCINIAAFAAGLL